MVYLNAKEDKEIKTIIEKCKEHIGESFNRDLITIEELVDLTLDFISEIENLKEEIAEMKRDKPNEIEARMFINCYRLEE